MRLLEGISQIIAILVGILGAAGYVLVLGAVVLWIRLDQAHFGKALPLSVASREELIVIGAQALAVWLALALLLLAFASRIAEGEVLTRDDVVFLVLMGVAASILTTVAIHFPHDWRLAVIGVYVLAAVVWSALGVFGERPPTGAVGALVLSIGVGVGIPVVLAVLSDSESAHLGTMAVVWATFVLVLLVLPVLQSERASINSGAAAVSALELRREESLAKAGESSAPMSAMDTRLLATLRAELASARTRFLMRSIAAVTVGLLLLGGTAVATQYERKHLFREATVTLANGECVSGTYITRNKEQIVVGDRPGGRLLVLPADGTKRLEVKDPSGEGVAVTHTCTGIRPGVVQILLVPLRGAWLAIRAEFEGGKDKPRPGTGDGEGAPGKPGADGAAGAPGGQGGTGGKGGQGGQGGAGATGDTGQRGRRGPRGRHGRRGRQGEQGPQGPQGPPGPVIVDGGLG
jgi:hypothetical protein